MCMVKTENQYYVSYELPIKTPRNLIRLINHQHFAHKPPVDTI